MGSTIPPGCSIDYGYDYFGDRITSPPDFEQFGFDGEDFGNNLKITPYSDDKSIIRNAECLFDQFVKDLQKDKNIPLLQSNFKKIILEKMNSVFPANTNEINQLALAAFNEHKESVLRNIIQELDQNKANYNNIPDFVERLRKTLDLRYRMHYLYIPTRCINNVLKEVVAGKNINFKISLR